MAFDVCVAGVDAGDFGPPDRHLGGLATQNTSRCEGSCGDLVSGIGMAVLTRAALGVVDVIEARRVRTLGCMAAQASLIGDLGRLLEREGRLLREVHPHLFERDCFVGQPRHSARVDMALNAAHRGVRPLRPRIVVGPHLMACGRAEGRLIGRTCDAERRREDRRYAQYQRDY